MGTVLDPRQRTTLCAPRGGVDLGSDMRTFYRIDAKARRLDPASFAAAVEQLDDALDRACAETGTSRSDAILAGFSQGAGLAMGLSFRRSDRPSPAGVVAMSGKLYDEVAEVCWDLEPRSGADGGPTRPKLLWVHGTADGVFGHDLHVGAVARLRAAAIEVTTLDVDAGHVLTPEALAAARDWLATNWLDDCSGGST